MAEMVGLCSICGRPSPMNTCHLCGRLVCDRCFTIKHGICIECCHGRQTSKNQTFTFD